MAAAREPYTVRRSASPRRPATSLVMGWALNAWIDYIDFTAKGGGSGF